MNLPLEETIVVMLARCRWILAAALLIGGFGPLAGHCGPPSSEDLTDAQKLKVVYRMYAEYRQDFPSVPEISPREAMDLMSHGRVVFVDTRRPEEIEVSRLPGAVEREVFDRDPQRFTDRVVVAYCTISYRSGLFARAMAARGVAVRNLKGGLLAWVLEGGRVTDARGRETRRIHVYGKKWKYPPAGYEALVFGWLERTFE